MPDPRTRRQKIAAMASQVAQSPYEAEIAQRMLAGEPADPPISDEVYWRSYADAMADLAEAAAIMAEQMHKLARAFKDVRLATDDLYERAQQIREEALAE